MSHSAAIYPVYKRRIEEQIAKVSAAVLMQCHSVGGAGMEQITLNNGTLAFSALACGPDDGVVVLLLHGFPDNPHTFSGQLKALADSGYRAIAPTLRGYEPSSQPVDGDYRVGAMARDVLAWLDGLGAIKVHIVGHDWGAAVASVACSLAPERFHSLTTMAVPHPPGVQRNAWKVPIQALNSSYMVFFQLPWISDWALSRNDWAMVRWLCSIWSPGFSLSDADWASRRETFEAPGVLRAMLAYYRQNASLGVALGLVRSEVFSLSTVPVRTLALAGELDGCMDARMFDYAFCEEDFPSGVQVQRIAGGGHFLHLDAPDAVNESLLAWVGQRGVVQQQ